MPKKHIPLIACILISVLLMSCQGAGNEVPAPSPTATHTPDVAPSSSTAPAVQGYSITDDAYTEGDSIIRYPQIAGLTDTAMEDQINTLIKDDATAIKEEGGTIDVSYSATWAGPNLLSIRYEGLRTMPDAAYPNNLFYTTNVDIANGTKVRLDDVITVDGSFIEKIGTGEYVTQDSGLKEVEDLIRETIAGYNLAGALANADNGYGQENPDYCFTYFTENALGISIAVPHAIGDHAEFEIGYPSLQENIKQNGIWNDFADVMTAEGVSGIGIADLYGDWVVSGHLISNPQGSTYSQEDIEDMIGTGVSYAKDRAAFGGEILEPPYYQVTTMTREEYEADGSVTFDDLGIETASVMDVTVCTDPQFQNVWLIPASFVFIRDKDHLIIRGDGEFFALTRQ